MATLHWQQHFGNTYKYNGLKGTSKLDSIADLIVHHPPCYPFFH